MSFLLDAISLILLSIFDKLEKIEFSLSSIFDKLEEKNLLSAVAYVSLLVRVVQVDDSVFSDFLLNIKLNIVTNR